MKRREQARLHALDEDQSDVQRGEHDDGDQEVLQSNVKFEPQGAGSFLRRHS
jgi:hypothetical protein